MLDIIYIDRVKETKQNATWHIGEQIPLDYHDMMNVQQIQADGHELEHIIKKFTILINSKGLSIVTIPINPNQRVHRWFGDIAKTICANL